MQEQSNHSVASDSNADVNSLALRRAIIASSLMIGTSLLAHFWKPIPEPVVTQATFTLDVMVPKSFGEWTQDTNMRIQMVNPETKQLLDKIYSQMVTRTYVNPAGQRVMLSIAYGSDQRGALQAHKPEVCYPAQGFVLKDSFAGAVKTPFGDVAAQRMNAVKGNRVEPVTYWFTVGNRQVQTAFERRIESLKATLTGQIPDGLLFRVSSIEREPKLAFEVHDQFINQMLSAVDQNSRTRLAGIVAQ